jgi:hypothetical protein
MVDVGDDRHVTEILANRHPPSVAASGTHSATRHGRAIEEAENQFVILRGHELPEVEDIVAEHGGYIIVSKRGAAEEFVQDHA